MDTLSLPISGLFILRFNSLVMLEGHPWVLPAKAVSQDRDVFRIGGWLYDLHCQPLHPCAPDIAEAWDPEKDSRSDMMRRRSEVEAFLTRPSAGPQASLALVDAVVDQALARWDEPVIRPSWGILRDMLHVAGVPLRIGTFQRCVSRCPIRAYRGVPVVFKREVRCEVGGRRDGVYEAVPIVPRQR
jgi:hypothetical protein